MKPLWQVHEVEAIERATVSAVSPQELLELEGWLLPFDPGTVGRARSAVPLSHAAPRLAVLEEIEAEYAARGLPAMLRTPQLAAFEGFRAALLARGYTESTVTNVCIAPAARVRAVSDGAACELRSQPDADWASLFLGQGFDPVDGASRVQKLGQATGSLFATLREAGRPVAAGAAAFSHGWASVHGMRTAQHCRGRGLAGQVLAALGGAAIDRGHERVFLQVAAENASAHALYRRAGFEGAWTYSYWRRASA